MQEMFYNGRKVPSTLASVYNSLQVDLVNKLSSPRPFGIVAVTINIANDSIDRTQRD